MRRGRNEKFASREEPLIYFSWTRRVCDEENVTSRVCDDDARGCLMERPVATTAIASDWLSLFGRYCAAGRSGLVLRVRITPRPPTLTFCTAQPWPCTDFRFLVSRLFFRPRRIKT